jgi:23S rRNA (adenine2030-N6)-methyltransferase
VNYRHAFHAGNHADVLKHAVLLFCLDALRRKPTPFAVLDTHAGRGLYDLTGEEAQRSPEWRDGVARLWNWPEPPPLVARYLAALRAWNGASEPLVYPGSPLLIAALLREDDALMACELHPEEFAALQRTLPQRANVHLHARDGWEALLALTPPPQRRGLVLIDPPYEAEGELATAARALGPLLKRFGHGVVLWWRPLKRAGDVDAADAELREILLETGPRETLRADLWVDAPKPDGRLVGSSLMLINPPFGLQDALHEALPFLADALIKGRSGWDLRRRT